MTPVEGGYSLTVTAKRSNVPADFVAVIPVRIDYEDGKMGVLFITNRQDEQSVTHKLAKRPKRVVFAPDHSLLASIRRE